MDCAPAAGAFPSDSVPGYLLRDRDRIFAHNFVEKVKAMGIKHVLSVPAHRGSAHMSNASSGQSDASVWIT